jgi:hypothetical protein
MGAVPAAGLTVAPVEAAEAGAEAGCACSAALAAARPRVVTRIRALFIEAFWV